MALPDRSGFGSGCIWGALGALVLLPLVGFGALAASAYARGDGDAGATDLAVGGATALIFAAMAPLSVLAITSRQRSGPIVQALTEMQRGLGGAVRVPTFLRPGGWPELRTRVDGVEAWLRLEIVRPSLASAAIATAADRPGALHAPDPLASRVQLTLRLDTPVAAKLYAFPRTGLATLGAGLLGVQEARVGVADFDQRFVVLSDRPADASALLARDPEAMRALAGVMTANAPFFVRLGLDASGASWTTPRTGAVTAERVAEIARAIHDLAARLGWRRA